MKRILAAILSAAMLSVPAYADEAYTKEELVARAKSVCSIEDYEEFDITSSKKGEAGLIYIMSWSDDNKGSVTLTMGADGCIYSYDSWNRKDVDKVKIYTDSQARAAADEFIKKALVGRNAGDSLDGLEYRECNNYDTDTYNFEYTITHKGIPTSCSAYVNVDKYTNKVRGFNYDTSAINSAYGEFINADDVEKAKESINKGFKLGYSIVYDNDDKMIPKIIYRFDSNSIRADNFEPFNNNMAYYTENSMAKGAAASDASSALTPAEKSSIEVYKNAITLERAVEAINKCLNKNVSVNDIGEYRYYKDEDEQYGITLNTNTAGKMFSATVDSKGRIVSFMSYGSTENDNTAGISDEECEKRAEALISALNTRGYELTDIKKVTEYDDDLGSRYECSLMRNGCVSFDEGINVNFDKNGDIIQITASYYRDDLFTADIKAEITREQALDIVYQNNELKPYYYISVDYSDPGEKIDVTNIFAFENQYFAIDAVKGKMVNIDGSELSDNSVKEYTDLDSQWYAEAARNMAYMGYAFEGEEFKGDEALTYGDLNKFYPLYMIGRDKYKNDDVLTRYGMAEIMMDIMYCNVSKYNEIYVKPFDDVDFQHTGCVAILKAMGIVGGDSFRGNDNITRGEACTMLFRYKMTHEN